MSDPMERSLEHPVEHRLFSAEDLDRCVCWWCIAAAVQAFVDERFPNLHD